MSKKKKVPWNLSINPEVKRLMEIYCAVVGVTPSEQIERVLVEFLEKNRVRETAPNYPSKPMIPLQPRFHKTKTS